MNVLVLSELFYPHGSGGELATYLWVELLARSGFNIRIVTAKFPNEPEVSRYGNVVIYRVQLPRIRESVKYSVLGKPGILLSAFVGKFMAWADVIYIPRFWYTAIPIAKARGKPVIVHLHDYIPICPLAVLYDLSRGRVCHRGLCHQSCILAYERAQGKNMLEVLGSSLLNPVVWPHVGRLVAMSDAVICVSKAHKNVIVSRMSSIGSKCHVIYNPLPKVIEIKGNGGDMGYFGGANPLKGFTVLLRALKRVKTKVTVHATGFNPHNPGAAKTIDRSKIIFYERLPRERLESIYGKVSTVLFPSIWLEPSGYVVCEALLSRRLVIASKIGGVPELVNGCPGAFLFPPGNDEMLAELIDHVKSLSPQTELELGRRNRDAFLRRFSNEECLKQFSWLLDHLC
jgi:glycosyltransferase involved in cell wall biosynthesis